MNTLFSPRQYSIKYFSVLYLSVRKPVHDQIFICIYILFIARVIDFLFVKTVLVFKYLALLWWAGGGPSEGLFICPDSGNKDGTACNAFYLQSRFLFSLLQIPVISVPTVSFQNIDFSAISLKFRIQ